MRIELSMMSALLWKVPGEGKTTGATCGTSNYERGNPRPEVYIPGWCIPPNAWPDEHPDHKTDNRKRSFARGLKCTQKWKRANRNDKAYRNRNGKTEYKRKQKDEGAARRDEQQ